jgi:hypothetical protein
MPTLMQDLGAGLKVVEGACPILSAVSFLD